MGNELRYVKDYSSHERCCSNPKTRRCMPDERACGFHRNLDDGKRLVQRQMGRFLTRMEGAKCATGKGKRKAKR
jgi:hypothetical protein